ncbi:hypothetical protein CLW00_107272 [Mongoliibacter ruber]|uniref:Uncharacterized protein n=1 Tax=Mongoliibacter ruber TaxID=1750599 RepID=A0A2T0WKL9_9BACT|nr:hypothetical protein CLW00_107272 [Mongoliibacter ruber]
MKKILFEFSIFLIPVQVENLSTFFTMHEAF